jgi:Bacterial Ig domain
VYAWNNRSAIDDPVDILPGGGTGTALHVQESRDYFNLAKPGYAPYPYPHPLTASPALDTEPPVVAITSPLPQAILSGSITVAAVAWDNVGVAAARFLLDGADVGPQEDAPPSVISREIAGVAPGTHTLTAVASDAAGNTAVSPAVLFYTVDTTPPVVSVSLPLDGAAVSGAAITVSATASDDVGVEGVQFLLDGDSLGAEATSSPYAIVWNATQTTNGPHVLTASARDAAGNVTTSAAVTVTVTVASGPASYYPSTYSVGTGTYQGGDAASLTANDNDYLVVGSTTYGRTRRSTADFGFDNVAPGSRLDYSVRLKSSTSSTRVIVYAFNYVSTTWTQLSTSSIGTGEVTVSASIAASAASYISPDGRMSLRVQSSKRSSHSISSEVITVAVTP